MSHVSQTSSYWSSRNPALYGDLAGVGLLGTGLVRAVKQVIEQQPFNYFGAHTSLEKWGYIMRPLASFAPLGVMAIVEGRILASDLSSGAQGGLSIVNIAGTALVSLYAFEKVGGMIGRGTATKIFMEMFGGYLLPKAVCGVFIALGGLVFLSAD